MKYLTTKNLLYIAIILNIPIITMSEDNIKNKLKIINIIFNNLKYIQVSDDNKNIISLDKQNIIAQKNNRFNTLYKEYLNLHNKKKKLNNYSKKLNNFYQSFIQQLYEEIFIPLPEERYNLECYISQINNILKEEGIKKNLPTIKEVGIEEEEEEEINNKKNHVLIKTTITNKIESAIQNINKEKEFVNEIKKKLIVLIIKTENNINDFNNEFEKLKLPLYNKENMFGFKKKIQDFKNIVSSINSIEHGDIIEIQIQKQLDFLNNGLSIILNNMKQIHKNNSLISFIEINKICTIKDTVEAAEKLLLSIKTDNNNFFTEIIILHNLLYYFNNIINIISKNKPTDDIIFMQDSITLLIKKFETTLIAIKNIQTINNTNDTYNYYISKTWISSLDEYFINIKTILANEYIKYNKKNNYDFAKNKPNIIKNNFIYFLQGIYNIQNNIKYNIKYNDNLDTLINEYFSPDYAQNITINYTNDINQKADNDIFTLFFADKKYHNNYLLLNIYNIINDIHRNINTKEENVIFINFLDEQIKNISIDAGFLLETKTNINLTPSQNSLQQTNSYAHYMLNQILSNIITILMKKYFEYYKELVPEEYQSKITSMSHLEEIIEAIIENSTNDSLKKIIHMKNIIKDINDIMNICDTLYDPHDFNTNRKKHIENIENIIKNLGLIEKKYYISHGHNGFIYKILQKIKEQGIVAQ